MSLMRALYRKCDHAGCEKWDKADDSVIHHVIGGEDFCSCHYPLPRCARCTRRVRPYGTTAAKWPSTVSKHSTSPLLCGTCYEQTVRGARNRGKVRVCSCGATTKGVTPGWWVTKFYGPLCPAHAHPLCGGCFRPVHGKDQPATKESVKYSGRGLCVTCVQDEYTKRGANTRRVVLVLPENTLELARTVVPADLWDMLGIGKGE